MSGQELYELFTAAVSEHELRGAMWGPGTAPTWDELRERSKDLWIDFAKAIRAEA